MRERKSCIILEYIAVSGNLPSHRWPKDPGSRLRRNLHIFSHDNCLIKYIKNDDSIKRFISRDDLSLDTKKKNLVG